MKKSSKNRLVPRHGKLFGGDSLFDRIARAVCRAGTLPRKELYEAWETARRVRRRFRGGRVMDLACGHGLLAQILMILDNTSPHALAVDKNIPENAGLLSDELIKDWPKLAGRISFINLPIEEVAIDSNDLVVSAHACGTLTDRVINKAVEARARVAVLPCCHNLKRSPTGGLTNWMAPDLAVDAVRAMALKSEGYEIFTARIPSAITPKNRLLMGKPLAR